MPRDARVKCWIGALTLLVGFGASSVQARDAKLATAPASTLQAFYHSYLVLVNDSKDPLRSDPSLMSRYVDKFLLTRLRRKIDNDEDYFTKSQDILDDWMDHIAVPDQKCSQTNCKVQVVLGLSKTPLYKIDVDVKNVGGEWKITKVAKPAVDR